MWKIESYKASWLESFDLLKPDNIKLLLLVSVRSLISVYRSFLYAWFLPLALLVGLVLEIPRLIGAFYITLLVRAARPSMTYKRFNYWQQPVFADWIIFFGVLLLVYLPKLWTGRDLPSFFLKVLWHTYSLILRLFFLNGQTWFAGAEALGSMLIFLSPFIIIWGLFMLDAKTGVWSYIKAFGRAFLMLAYNYPFFLITYALLRIIIAIGYLLSAPFTESIPQLPLIGWVVLVVIIIPYWVCFLTNFYVKRVHEQFSLYYAG